jgi:hypothetical protein
VGSGQTATVTATTSSASGQTTVSFDAPSTLNLLSSMTFPSGTTTTCTVTSALNSPSGGSVVINSGATVTFQAPVITLYPGFHATPGSSFTAIP